jgi:hypothetical protein
VNFTFDGDCDNANTRGPSRIVEQGPVSLGLTDPDAEGPYERQTVNSVYCHVATQPDGETPLMPPDDDATVSISTKIAEIGPWNNGQALLRRGYFFCDHTTLLLRVIATGAQVGDQWSPVLTYWPSVTGTHLVDNTNHCS